MPPTSGPPGWFSCSHSPPAQPSECAHGAAPKLGARDWAVTYRVILPQIWPRILNGIRLNLKAIALFLFAGEMIASTDGLAYRIALLQRHMGMDLIIPYVLWVALLLFLVDGVFRLFIRWTNPWFHEA